MPTPSEQKALAFLAFVLLLGGAVRVLRAGAPSAATSADQQALALQTEAANAAALQEPRKRIKGARVSRSRRRAVADTVAGVAGIPFSDVRPDRDGGTPRQYNPREGWINGYPPPSPRLDTGNRQDPLAQGILPGPARTKAAGRPVAPAVGPVDLDAADARAIEALPRIGPALAARLVANRDSFGPFGSLQALRRVRGMGPATLDHIAPYVTFSGRPASSSAGSRYH